MTISPERERQLLASAAYPGDALRAIQFLLGRVRELEAEIKATDILLVTLNDREDELTESLVEVLAGWRCLATQCGGVSTYDAAIIDKAHTALEGGRNDATAPKVAGSP